MFRSVVEVEETANKLNVSCTMHTMTEKETIILSSPTMTILRIEKTRTYMPSTVFLITVKNLSFVDEKCNSTSLEKILMKENAKECVITAENN